MASFLDRLVADCMRPLAQGPLRSHARAATEATAAGEAIDLEEAPAVQQDSGTFGAAPTGVGQVPERVSVPPLIIRAQPKKNPLAPSDSDLAASGRSAGADESCEPRTDPPPVVDTTPHDGGGALAGPINLMPHQGESEGSSDEIVPLEGILATDVPQTGELPAPTIDRRSPRNESRTGNARPTASEPAQAALEQPRARSLEPELPPDTNRLPDSGQWVEPPRKMLEAPRETHAAGPASDVSIPEGAEPVPKLVIGRIDIFVEAPRESAGRGAVGHDTGDRSAQVSAAYLRRL